MRKIEPLTVAVFAALLWLGFYGGQIGGCPLPDIVSPSRATAATYVYEKDDTAIPGPVLVAFDKLNRREPKVNANVFEQDTKDGSGETPDQYKVPLAAALAAGLPALAVTANEKVLKVVKDPKTEEAVLEAVP